MEAQPLLRLSGLIFVFLTVWYSFYIISPPDAKPSTAPPSEFSAERAFGHIRNIAREPRPLGSQANDSTRAYLIRQLREMGLQPFIQEGVGMNSRRAVAGYTRNVLAELPGTDSLTTIMLMAHYDSVPVGPGAGDDASGVATILEVVRALTAGHPLQHNVLVLFTDGEERGLLGAELFIDQYTGWEQIDLVINMEARGTSGPSIMFETSVNNSELIPHFADATIYPVANSLTYTIYKLLPNNTDLSVMKRAGLNGLNYAFIDGFLNYHTSQDIPENLSLGSLQHHGENLLSNVRYFGTVSLNLDGKSDYAYFNNLTGGIAFYPAGWSFPLAIITGLIFIAYLILLFRRNRMQITTYLLSTLTWILIVIIGGLITYYGWQLVRWLHPEYRWFIQGETYNHEWYLYGFSALILALVIASANWLRKKLKGNNLLGGVYTLWILLSLAVGWYLPTAAYLFTWPALFGLLGWMATEPRLGSLNWKYSGILWLSLLPALFIIPPYIKLIQIAMTTSLLTVSMILLLLLAGLCLPLLWQITGPRPGYWAGGFIAVSLFCGIGAALNSDYDASHKKQNSLIYLADLDENQAFWASQDHTTDEWTSQFLNTHFPDDSLMMFGNLFGRSRLLLAEAPLRAFEPATIQVRADSSADSLRYLSLRMSSDEPGIGMYFVLSGTQAFREVTLFGKKMREQRAPGDFSPSFNGFFYFTDLTEPIELDLVMLNPNPEITFEITSFRHELPADVMGDYNSRDSFMMPTPSSLSDATVWKKTYRLGDLK